jgi:GTPase SAR1 family protein
MNFIIKEIYNLLYSLQMILKKIKLQIFFMKYINYYHEISISKSNNFHSFNILVCGPAGVGKSSFINQFLEEKLAKEGEGVSVTHETTKYFLPKYSITIFDNLVLK